MHSPYLSCMMKYKKVGWRQEEPSLHRVLFLMSLFTLLCLLVLSWLPVPSIPPPRLSWGYELSGCRMTFRWWGCYGCRRFWAWTCTQETVASPPDMCPIAQTAGKTGDPTLLSSFSLPVIKTSGSQQKTPSGHWSLCSSGLTFKAKSP